MCSVTLEDIREHFKIHVCTVFSPVHTNKGSVNYTRPRNWNRALKTWFQFLYWGTQEHTSLLGGVKNFYSCTSNPIFPCFKSAAYHFVRKKKINTTIYAIRQYQNISEKTIEENTGQLTRLDCLSLLGTTTWSKD